METLDSWFRSHPNLHPQIDTIERLFVDKGRTVKQIARRLRTSEEEIRSALLDVGLEVHGEVRSGLVSSYHAAPPSELAEEVVLGAPKRELR